VPAAHIERGQKADAAFHQPCVQPRAGGATAPAASRRLVGYDQHLGGAPGLWAERPPAAAAAPGSCEPIWGTTRFHRLKSPPKIQGTVQDTRDHPFLTPASLARAPRGRWSCGGRARPSSISGRRSGGTVRARPGCGCLVTGSVETAGPGLPPGSRTNAQARWPPQGKPSMSRAKLSCGSRWHAEAGVMNQGLGAGFLPAANHRGRGQHPDRLPIVGADRPRCAARVGAGAPSLAKSLCCDA